MGKISVIEPKIPSIPKRYRVAAYARVSLESENLLHSLSAQISYYSELIQNNPDWEYAGVYADRFVSGTGTVKRPEFQRLIADCDAGLVDIVLVKSISRFARNTVDLLNTVRHLKHLGVDVRFEKEGISSLSSDGEFMLTILSSFAEQESLSLSNNIKWAIQKKYEKGESYGARRCLGYRWEDGHYVIVPEEADLVKSIFSMYLEGLDGVQIAAALKEKGIVGIRGNPLSPCYVLEVLDNITYQGDLRFQDHYSPTLRHSKKNYGEVPKYVLTDAHEAIISREMFAKVKTIRDRNRKYRGRKRANCFARKMFCGVCGTSMQRFTARLAHSQRKYWECRLKVTSHGEECQAKHIYEELLEKMTSDALDINPVQYDTFDPIVERILVYDEYLEFHTYDKGVIRWQR